MHAGPAKHVPVLVEEVLAWLEPRPGQTLVDGTLGGGGHTQQLIRAVWPGGRVIALDRDPSAIESARERLKDPSIHLVWSNYCDLPEVLQGMQVEAVDGILLDLGLSSDQLADAARGFSFDSSGPLDLRFDPTTGQPAWRLLERLSEAHLADLLYRYGEERFSRRIARRIVAQRAVEPIRRADQLARLVRSCVPRTTRRQPAIDPATRTFQALRIAVNDELAALDTALSRLAMCLRPGGRLAVISYHSLEDRRVKTAFRKDPHYEELTRRPIRPTAEEVTRNPRSRSAKLRVARRRAE
jgi:16S rRNA (cytosine1402-N4)-methyltransferase